VHGRPLGTDQAAILPLGRRAQQVPTIAAAGSRPASLAEPRPIWPTGAPALPSNAFGRPQVSRGRPAVAMLAFGPSPIPLDVTGVSDPNFLRLSHRIRRRQSLRRRSHLLR